MAGELKLCPFCGSAARSEHDLNHWTIWCPNDLCAVTVEATYERYIDANTAWNRRTPPGAET